MLITITLSLGQHCRKFKVKCAIFAWPQLQLRDKNERFLTKLGYLESRLGHLASSNTDLSHRLVQSEEEKLKVEGWVTQPLLRLSVSVQCSSRGIFLFLFFQISKEFVEEKIQTNKMREHFEEETFELKNKVTQA